MAAITQAALPSGIVRYEDYVAQQKIKPTNTNMGQTEFLTLFTTQLKNQNPLDPVKNEAFVAQLAQFSQLEATTAMKSSMEKLTASLINERLLGATSLIGKTVAVPDGPLLVTDTTVSQGIINLPAGADSVAYQVLNEQGALVKSITMGPQLAGDVILAWDGGTDSGGVAANGTYRYVATVSSKGTVFKPPVSTYAKVNGVTSSAVDGTTLLEIDGGKTMSLNDVKRVAN